MLKIENWEVVGWEHAIRGMRNPLNSWDKSDSYWTHIEDGMETAKYEFFVGDNDLDLMERLRNAGTDHRKYLRFIECYVDVLAPLYWWKEFDTYRIGVEKNSCSTMHKIHSKEFTIDDFSHEHLIDMDDGWIEDEQGHKWCSPLTEFETYIHLLNACRYKYNQTKDKKYWWQMIQLLPTSYNQKRTVKLSYEALANIYKSRKNHKLDEWHTLCDWIEQLPYSELIAGKEPKDEQSTTYWAVD